MVNCFLIRYGELSLKKTNRKQFVSKINQHIKNALGNYPTIKYISEGMRFYIHLNGAPSAEVALLLQKIPGIHSFSPVSCCASELQSIKECAKMVLETALTKEKTKIKVETNRADKTFPLTSIAISQQVGNHLFKNVTGIIADVHHPELTIYIDVRAEGTFVYTEIIAGLGGFPAGSIGKVLLMVSGGIDSIVSGYLAIKKGMDIEAVHFASPPYTSINALQKVIDLLETLLPYTSNQSIKLHVVPFTNIQEKIYQEVRDDYGITIMRRMMYRISSSIAKKRNCLAIFNGENIGQVASQTLESIGVISEAINYPVIRPLATFDKQDIIDIATRINTYAISIRPYEDCCTVFVPRHPQIKPRLQTVVEQEAKFDYPCLIEEALTNTNVITLKFNHHHDLLASTDEIF